MGKPNLNAIVERIHAYLAGRPEVRFAYLFGSWARGTVNVLSDIDVAIFLEEGTIRGGSPYGYKAEVIADLMKVLKTNQTDVVILNTAPPLLRLQVVRDGIPLICRSTAERDAFVANTYEEYENQQGLLDDQTCLLLRRLKEGTFGRS